MTVHISKASLADAQEILQLQHLCYQIEADLYDDYQIQPLTQSIQDIEQEFQQLFVLKAVHNSTIVGSVRAYDTEGTCHVGKLIVHPDYQNQGIATQLMNQLEICFSHCSRFELYTGYRSERNLYLYSKLGYVPFKTVKVHERLSFIYLEKKRGV